MIPILRSAGLYQRQKAELKKREALGKPLAMSFKALDGSKIDLAKMKGKVVLIDFWATWCGPCVREIPSVKKTYDDLHKQGFEIIGISMDSDKKKLEDFLPKTICPGPSFLTGRGGRPAWPLSTESVVSQQCGWLIKKVISLTRMLVPV